MSEDERSYSNWMNRRSRIVIPIMLAISVVLAIYLSAVYDVCPAGVIAFGRSSDFWVKLSWWLWPIFWMPMVFVFFEDKRLQNSGYDRLLYLQGYLALLLMPRVVIFLLNVILLRQYSDVLPSLDGMTNQVRFSWDLLIFSASGNIPINILLVVWGFSLIALYIQYDGLRHFINNRFQIPLLGFFVLSVVLQQLATSTRSITMVTFGFIVMLFFIVIHWLVKNWNTFPKEAQQTDVLSYDMKQLSVNIYKTISRFTKRNTRILAILWITDFGLYLLSYLLYFIFKNPVFDFIAKFAFGLMFICLIIRTLFAIRTITIINRRHEDDMIN